MPVVPGPDSPDQPARGGDPDTLIKDIADHNREDDLLKLINELPRLPLYFPLAAPLPENMPHGKHTVVAGEHIKCQTASVHGLECALAFTAPADPGLNPERIMIEGLEACRMVLQTNLDGLLIQSLGTAWVIIDRKRIEHILSPQRGPTLLEEVGRTLRRIFRVITKP